MANLEIFENAIGGCAENLIPGNDRRLRAEWQQEMSIPALIGLRDELDGTLHRIRADASIQTPIITCRRCGKKAHAAEPRVSVRALILALGRFKIARRSKPAHLNENGQHTASNTSWTAKEEPQ